MLRNLAKCRLICRQFREISTTAACGYCVNGTFTAATVRSNNSTQSRKPNVNAGRGKQFNILLCNDHHSSNNLLTYQIQKVY